MDEKKLAEFKAAHGREGRISVGDGTCDVCRKDAVCILIDSSEGEYGEGAICKPCIDAAFDAASNESKEKP